MSQNNESLNQLGEARKALRCLYLAVDESIAKDVEQKVEAAFLYLAGELIESAKQSQTSEISVTYKHASCQGIGCPDCNKTGRMPCRRATKPVSKVDAALEVAAEILVNFKDEKDRAKIEEWQACYAMLFKQMNDLVNSKSAEQPVGISLEAVFRKGFEYGCSREWIADTAWKDYASNPNPDNGKRPLTVWDTLWDFIDKHHDDADHEIAALALVWIDKKFRKATEREISNQSKGGSE